MGAFAVPTTFLNNTDEAEAAAKNLGAGTAKQAVTEQARKAETKPAEAGTTSAAAKQADTKQKIKKQAAAAKEDAPVSTPVTTPSRPHTRPHTRPAQLCERLTSIACRATNSIRSVLEILGPVLT